MPFSYVNGVMYDLNDYTSSLNGFSLSWAMAINDRGQIVGYGYAPSAGGSHAFLLTPQISDVPEPGSVAALAALALTGAGFLRKRKRF